MHVSLMHASGNKKSGALIEEEDGKFKRETGVFLGQNIILYIRIVLYSMYCSPENVSLSAEDCFTMKKDMRNTNHSVYIEKIAVQQKWIFVTLNCQQQAFKKNKRKTT